MCTHATAFGQADLPRPEIGQVFSYSVYDDKRWGKVQAVDLEPIETFDGAAQTTAATEAPSQPPGDGRSLWDAGLLISEDGQKVLTRRLNESSGNISLVRSVAAPRAAWTSRDERAPAQEHFRQRSLARGMFCGNI